jgi:transcriptional regulator with XRE-family HTH domain
MTQLELARELGVTPTTVSRWERGLAPQKSHRQRLLERFPDLVALAFLAA